MIKITDQNYTLPIVEALGPIKEFDSGANKPLLIIGVDENGTKGDYVVKFRGAERMSNEAFMRELLAAFIAMQMEIPVVNPAIVNISHDFVDLLKGNSAWQYANASIGYNYSSEYLKDYLIMPVNQVLNNHQLNYAQTIFAFDILIQNSDRRVEKPNMLTNGNEIIILDHELAFGFIFDIIKDTNPWIIKQKDLEWIRLHCLLPKIKHKDFGFDEFSKRLNNLDENFWNTAWSLIPENWRFDQFNIIKNHFIAISENRDSFILELKKLMS